MLRRIPTVPSLFASTSRTRAFSAPARPFPRLRTAKQPQSSLAAEETSSSHAEPSNAEPATHYRITLMRSALGLPSYARETLAALGLKKRMQHVFHPFSGTTAGQILRVKELVVVQNVPASAVRTKQEERLLRRPNRGFQVLGRQGRPWAVEDEFAGVTREQEQELTEEVRAGNPPQEASA
ncbi:hypothetical protein CALVIDRAFT_537002 [Calocera viscosa TUFC12733]|uniref:Large ribosomal subunit protein uL30m n=1 Tax=Calocera viscosa (strain TUFC12733) TaxID=1330018 RepID=A0A167MEM6_CALVF|nr:hypothetical protein CALVIDRAFT_537002 [Calocera viscosa TUFC12733]